MNNKKFYIIWWYTESELPNCQHTLPTSQQIKQEMKQKESKNFIDKTQFFNLIATKNKELHC